MYRHLTHCGGSVVQRINGLSQHQSLPRRLLQPWKWLPRPAPVRHAVVGSVSSVPISLLCLTVMPIDSDDGDPTTTNDACRTGVCTGVSRCAAVTCSDGAQCLTSRCNPLTGACEDVAKANGTVCDDGRSTTVNDRCQVGVCVGQTDLCRGQSCGVLPCQGNGRCEPTTGTCQYDKLADNTTCDDGLETTVAACFNGTCVSTSKCAGVTCASVQCYSSSCTAVTGLCTQTVLPGGACDDGDRTTNNDVCLSDGSCQGQASCDTVVCSRRSQCHSIGTCQAGVCSDPLLQDGSPCDDG